MEEEEELAWKITMSFWNENNKGFQKEKYDRLVVQNYWRNL